MGQNKYICVFDGPCMNHSKCKSAKNKFRRHVHSSGVQKFWSENIKEVITGEK
jgi:hypothetical protein